MTDVKKNLHEVLANLPDGVQLVAISKYHPNEKILAAYEEGQRIFGESHEQELKRKHTELPADIEWHFPPGAAYRCRGDEIRTLARRLPRTA